MISTRKSCRNRPDIFCYICGEYTLVPNRNALITFIKQTYHAYFGMKLSDQDKAWAPHMVCKSCIEYLRQWNKGKKTNLKVGIPIVWREPRNHVSDCYLLMWLGLIERTVMFSSILILNQHVVLLLTLMNTQYLSMQCFLTTVVKILAMILKRMKKWVLAMILHILFLKMSLMILFVILICQSPQLRSWHPD